MGEIVSDRLHDYLLIYLIGCAFFIILWILNLVMHWSLGWITKENILNKNLNKLQPPNKNSSIKKSCIYFFVFLCEVLLSWIGVIVQTFLFIKLPLKLIREFLTVTPEEIKVLRFPLWNNPDLSRESVWALINALLVKTGEKQFDEFELIHSLEELTRNYPSFSSNVALRQLNNLKVIDKKIIESALSLLE